MQQKGFTVQEIGLIAATRVALGAGIGLLLANCLNEDQREGAGWTLFGLGLVTTIPLVVNLIQKKPVDRPVSLIA